MPSRACADAIVNGLDGGLLEAGRVQIGGRIGGRVGGYDRFAITVGCPLSAGDTVRRRLIEAGVHVTGPPPRLVQRV